MADKFNLIDEAWIPVAGKGRVSLKKIFSDKGITALGGNPVEKIAVFKLLLAIAQSACSPKNEEEWKRLGSAGMKKAVLSYLEKYHDLFYLYGKKPFLQMKGIEKAEKKSYGDVQMEVATGNTTVVTEVQLEKNLSDAEKAVLLITLMGFALGGKKTDNSIILSPDYTGKTAAGKPGPCLGFLGLLHSFCFCQNVLTSVYFNLFTEEQICESKMYPGGIGCAPWLSMPKGENDGTAQKLQKSYMGRLVPLNRFVLLDDDGIHYSEGIVYDGYDAHVVDPSVSVDFNAKPKVKVLWVDPAKKPWRQLTSLLSFLDSQSNTGFSCLQLKSTVTRCRTQSAFTVWSGGVRVSSNAGEQYLSGTDDFVESEVQLSSDIFGGAFFENLTEQMECLDKYEKMLYGRISGYFTDTSTAPTDASNLAAAATGAFWQLCEDHFQSLVDACSDHTDQRFTGLNSLFKGYVYQIYDQYCPKQTARQLAAWAKNKPVIK